jgi:acyl dehydratase
MRHFEDFTEGQVIELGTIPVLSEDEIIAFARQYDPQPFHIDPVAAKDTIYGGLIASGWQTALLTMRLMVDELLSETAAQGSPGVENIRFLKPVRAGDRLRGRYTETHSGQDPRPDRAPRRGRRSRVLDGRLDPHRPAPVRGPTVHPFVSAAHYPPAA